MKSKFNKTIQKIALILVCILSFNFIAPTYISNADVGGVLFSPIKSLILTFADVAMDVLDMGFTGKYKHVIAYDILKEKSGVDNGDMWEDVGDNDIDLPKFRLSPDAIFSNKVELLNIDFINPINEDDYDVKNSDTTKRTKRSKKINCKLVCCN